MTGEGRRAEAIGVRDRPVDLPPRAVGMAVRTVEQPVPVHAWVCLPRRGYVEVEGYAVYSPRAGRVRFVDDKGLAGLVCLWAAAITRVGPDAGARGGTRTPTPWMGNGGHA